MARNDAFGGNNIYPEVRVTNDEGIKRVDHSSQLGSISVDQEIRTRNQGSEIGYYVITI